jgi:hypothetical protein
MIEEYVGNAQKAGQSQGPRHAKCPQDRKHLAGEPQLFDGLLRCRLDASLHSRAGFSRNIPLTNAPSRAQHLFLIQISSAKKGQGYDRY